MTTGDLRWERDDGGWWHWPEGSDRWQWHPDQPDWPMPPGGPPRHAIVMTSVGIPVKFGRGSALFVWATIGFFVLLAVSLLISGMSQ